MAYNERWYLPYLEEVTLLSLAEYLNNYLEPYRNVPDCLSSSTFQLEFELLNFSTKSIHNLVPLPLLYK